MKQRLTIEDVARKVSLSISTVSLVLNNKPNVSDETRRRVKRAIRELGYHPHRNARGLASKSSGNIGFILTENHFQQSEPFYTRIFLGTEFAAREHNYYVLLTTVGEEYGTGESVPRFLLERNVDGVIIAGKIDERYVDRILAMGVPVVLVDFVFPMKSVSSVLIDNRRGAAAAVEHLLAQYHSAIAFIGGDSRHPSIAERFEGYREVLRLHGIPYADALVDVVENDTGVENGYNATRRLLGRVTPNAIFAANDAMALGCMRCLKERGMKIPAEIGVAGFDDIEASAHVEPRLTTVRVFKEEMGRIAIERVIDSLSSGNRPVVTVHVPVELVVSGSSVVHAD